jgi:shikimate kinase
MSGCGKSRWSTRLSELGFRRFCCDDLIAKKLNPVLTGPEGSIMELGEWMGFPYESQYKERESKYLACEIEVLVEVFEYLESEENYSEENIVVDTTGSVIYTGDEILTRLRRATTVVHLSTPPEVQDEMLKRYLANKRPVLWQDLFSKEPNETNDEALERCYPRLLAARERLYERYSDVTVGYYTRSQDSFGASEFINSIKSEKGKKWG